MPKQKIVIYYLTLTVIFASCFAVFHRTEHVPASVASSVFDWDHFVSTHDTGIPTDEERPGIEGICDTCLVLSYLNVVLPATYASLSLSLADKSPSSYRESPSQKPSLSYYSRAPPTAA